MRFRPKPALALLFVSLLTAACSKPASAPETPATTGAPEGKIEAPPPVPTVAEPGLSALAQMPGPAAGKWQFETEVGGRPYMPGESCVTAGTLETFVLPGPGIACPEQAVAQDGEVLKVHLECVDENGKPLTLDYTITGDLGRAYTVEHRQQLAVQVPGGTGEYTTITQATRLGDC